jgi:tripeptide aminopeptidase
MCGTSSPKTMSRWALSAVARLVADASSGRTTGPLWLLATVGEEGAGNLVGIRHALGHAPQPVAAVIVLEGNYLGRVVDVGVGSVRWRVDFTGAGGHAWERSTAPSAVHAAAAAATRISELSVPAARFSVNVATIGGGAAINARARFAWLEVDLRADAAEPLADLESQARETLAAATPGGITVRISDTGRRPAGQAAPSHPLVRAAVTTLEQAGVTAELRASSTDANAAHAAGVPAVALGRGRAHSEEWIETSPISQGLTALGKTIMLFWEAGG